MHTDVNKVEIVLIEDNPNDAELTIRALRKNHLSNNIVHLKDGEEAVSYFFDCGDWENHAIPKVILLDLKLPKVNGIEILKRLKSEPHTKLIPVVVLTSSQEERDVIGSYQLGVNSYVAKPVDFEQFMEAVSNLGLYWLLLNHPLQIR